MAIVFAPPEPYAGSISQAAGSAESQARGQASLADLYARAAALRGQSAAQEADRFARNDQVGQQLGERAQEHADSLQLQRDEYQASLNPHARDVFGAQVQEARLQQHAQLQAWVQQQDMTFAEQQRLQRMQAAVDSVNNAPDLSPEDKNNLLLQLKTGIDPLRQRQERARAEMEQAHAKAYLEKAQLDNKVLSMNLQAHAQGGSSTSQVTLDPFVKAQVEREMGPISAAEIALVGEAAAQARRAQQVEQKVIERGGYEQKTLEGFTAHGTPIWKKVEHVQPHRPGQAGSPRFADEAGGFDSPKALKVVEADAKAEYPVLKVPGPDGKGTVDKNAEDRANFIKNKMKELRAAHANAGDPTQRPTQAGEPDMKPFGPDKDANPDQLHQVSELSRQRDVVEKLPIPANLKVQFTAATYAMDALLRKYGTLDRGAVSRMDEQDQKSYDWARKSIDQVSRAGFYGPSAPPPPPGPAYNPMTLK